MTGRGPLIDMEGRGGGGTRTTDECHSTLINNLLRHAEVDPASSLIIFWVPEPGYERKNVI
jgi:hypothetical protein